MVLFLPRALSSQDVPSSPQETVISRHLNSNPSLSEGSICDSIFHPSHFNTHSTMNVRQTCQGNPWLVYFGACCICFILAVMMSCLHQSVRMVHSLSDLSVIDSHPHFIGFSCGAYNKMGMALNKIDNILKHSWYVHIVQQGCRFKSYCLNKIK